MTSGSGLMDSTENKAPLPASTGDAPIAPDTEVAEGQGLFTALSHLATSASTAATSAASNFTHLFAGDEVPTPTPIESEQPKSAFQTPAPGIGSQQASVSTVPSTDKMARDLSANPEPTVYSNSVTDRDPAEALKAIATESRVDNLSKELGTVDLNHTKLEITNAVESLGGAIAGALANIGIGHEGKLPCRDKLRFHLIVTSLAYLDQI